MRFELTTHVDAPPEATWAVLADVESWPEHLDSYDAVRITSSGAFGEGSTARVKQPGLLEATWTVTVWRPGSGFEWQSRSAGTTTVGRHHIETDDSGTRLKLGLHQHGLLAPLLALLIGGRARRYVQIELDGIKRLAEERAGQVPR